MKKRSQPPFSDRSSALIVNKSKLPAKRPDFTALEALPGLGHKTACVVMAQFFSVPAFTVDTHIHCLATRWKLNCGKNVVQTERDLKNLFPRDSWNKLHLQIILDRKSVV